MQNESSFLIGGLLDVFFRWVKSQLQFKFFERPLIELCCSLLSRDEVCLRYKEPTEPYALPTFARICGEHLELVHSLFEVSKPLCCCHCIGDYVFFPLKWDYICVEALS
jgi:hypothetical protein